MGLISTLIVALARANVATVKITLSMAPEDWQKLQELFKQPLEARQIRQTGFVPPLGAEAPVAGSCAVEFEVGTGTGLPIAGSLEIRRTR
jgi:hypothetical protein